MEFIRARWAAPAQIKALTTTRSGGVSEGCYAGLNLGDHVNDLPERVAKNRALLRQQLQLNLTPQWLSQVHGTELVAAAGDGVCREADACWSDQPGQACIVMTADCLPVFFCNREGTRVAVAHAGWRGLLDGVLEKTLSVFADPNEVLVWLGPAIGPDAFEVGGEVRDAFMQHQPEADEAFKAVADCPGKYLANLYQLACLRLAAAGVQEISSCDLCTYTDAERFYSYRRDGQTGRMASIIWIEPSL